jgi:hypothetical protein
MMNLYPLVNRGRKFFKITWTDKKMIMEAFCLTGIVRFCILFVAFSKLAKITGKYNEESDDILCDEQIFIGNKVAYVVNLVSRHTPWKSKCLVKALTAQIMIKRRKSSSTVYLGVAKDENKKLIAHAWLRCGNNVITGEDERTCFTQVAKFASHVWEAKK